MITPNFLHLKQQFSKYLISKDFYLTVLWVKVLINNLY